MTTREATDLNFWWFLLSECVREKGRAVTAGELAKRFGRSPTTAAKYLKKLVKNRGAVAQREKHWNKQPMTTYVPNTGMDV